MDVFTHVRILIGMILGLAITRLLSGLSRFVQHPTRLKPSAPHLIWVFAILLEAIHFWWWEFAFHELKVWHFAIYVFVLFYALLHFLLASLLFPDDIGEYEGYEHYFMSRRRWFFCLFALSFLIDIVDTNLKGLDHTAALGLEYDLRVALGLVTAAVGFFSARPRITAAIGLLWVVYDVSWIVRAYGTLGAG
jgi:hypothetical protein